MQMWIQLDYYDSDSHYPSQMSAIGTIPNDGLKNCFFFEGGVL